MSSVPGLGAAGGGKFEIGEGKALSWEGWGCISWREAGLASRAAGSSEARASNELPRVKTGPQVLGSTGG